MLTPLFFFQIHETIQAQAIRVYQPPVEVDDESSAEHAKMLMAAMPFSIIGSTEDVAAPDGRTVKGRQYMWGVAEGQLNLSMYFALVASLADM